MSDFSRDDDDEQELPPGEDFRDEEFADDGPKQDDTTLCPQCGREIYAGADRCPRCGDYVIAHAARKTAWPGWIWLGLLAAGGVLAAWALGR